MDEDAAAAIGVLVKGNVGGFFINPSRRQTTPAQWTWLLLGAVTFLFAFNAMGASYGWPTTLPGLIFDRQTDRYAVSLIASPVLLVLLIALAHIARMQAKTTPKGGWRERLVAPFGFGDRKARWLQNLDLAVLFLFPLASSISLFVKFLSGQFCLRGKGSQITGCDVPGATIVGNFLDHFRPVPFSDAVPLRRYVYQGGPDYAPFWEPWAFVVLWLILVVAVIQWMTELFRVVRPASD